MSLKNRKKYIGVEYVCGSLVALLTGKCRMALPKDANIVHVRAGAMLNIAEFLVISKEYPELEAGMLIPTECFSPEKINTISTQHAYSLREMVRWFKELIEQGNIPDAPSRSDELTIGYCDELLEDLK